MSGAVVAAAAPSGAVGGGLRGVFPKYRRFWRSGAAGQAGAGPWGGLRPAHRGQGAARDAHGPGGAVGGRGVRWLGRGGAGRGVGVASASRENNALKMVWCDNTRYVVRVDTTGG